MSHRIGCREAVRHLWRYLDDELDQVDRQAVDEHLSFCLRCCGEVEFAREVRSLLARSGPQVPPDVHDRLEAFIDELDTRGDAGAGATT